MEIPKYLVKHRLIDDKNAYTDYSRLTNQKYVQSDTSGLNISGREFSENLDDTIVKINRIWSCTNKLFAISTSESRSRGLKKIIENTLGAEAVPAAPGLFYFFKKKELQSFFYYNLQDSNSTNIQEDLLVYLALMKLKNEQVFTSMPPIIKDKITRHMGNNVRAMAESRKLLRDLADKKKIIQLCEDSEMGIQDGEALWIHTSLIKWLPPSLRVYIGCSALFYGDPESADIIKIHKKSSKVTYYLYDDFENKLLPEMHDRIKIDLGKQKVDHFDHRSNSFPEVMYFKDRFITASNKNYVQWNKFSKHLEENGYRPDSIHIEQNKNLTDILKSFFA